MVNWSNKNRVDGVLRGLDAARQDQLTLLSLARESLQKHRSALDERREVEPGDVLGLLEGLIADLQQVIGSASLTGISNNQWRKLQISKLLDDLVEERIRKYGNV